MSDNETRHQYLIELYYISRDISTLEKRLNELKMKTGEEIQLLVKEQLDSDMTPKRRRTKGEDNDKQ